MMATNFPTQSELMYSGISMVISHVLLMIAFFLHGVDYDAYTVHSEEDVLALHNVLSSDAHRIRIEIAVSLIWLSFPFLLVALYGLKQYVDIILEDAKTGRYVFEKAYLIWITVVLIIIPALSLSAVSYDWTFYEEISGNSIPSGYYVQVFITIFELELVDCVSVADATLLLSLFVSGRYMQYKSRKFTQYRTLVEGNSLKCVGGTLRMCCVIILFTIFVIILFEFAESGFFSPTSYAKVLAVCVLLIKMMYGFVMIYYSTNKAYNKRKELWSRKQYDDDEAKLTLDKKEHNYQMTQINTSVNASE